ncbi:hypothetical protein XNA1_3840003 [Xenorhabdus nematophila str. Anatoliense]|nr:hypothetical protein XNA1_1520003 [Xenorhabdus nematophila str. Anatoliense]CEE93488.1 hypothetical protein XNA1_3840003 [Xenorhabdus nematophila str. Anatoliense]
MTPPQEAKLRPILPEKWPSQMGLPYALWSRNAIQALACQKVAGETQKPN